jgi:hypothetical protein
LITANVEEQALTEPTSFYDLITGKVLPENDKFGVMIMLLSAMIGEIAKAHMIIRPLTIRHEKQANKY